MTRDDLDTLREGWDFEAKIARGKDGHGAVPHDLWCTYSAMANTSGGRIVLGVKELPDGRLRVAGLEDVDRVEKHLWDQLHDRHKISINLLSPEDVHRETIDGRTILVIEVPRATRSQRPVYINRDVMTGTFIRLHEGDHHAEPERVRRMIADALPEPQDGQVLGTFGLDDLHPDSISRYRNLLSARRPDHPFLAEGGVEFLRQVRAWGRDRETGREGPTLAGLLVLGRENAIRDRLPHFHLDYRELTDGDDGTRWTEREAPDGTWNANLLEFYRRVIVKLQDRLPVPFRLAPDLQRRDETRVHEALREALVNALIHADYRTGAGVRVFRAPDRFEFINPGTLLLPLDQIRRGGASECRNKNVQHLLGLVGLGERAGSGFPVIMRAWREQHWRSPSLREDAAREETTLRLSLESLLPAEVLEALRERLGEQFELLDEGGRMVLATAHIEGAVDHARLAEATGLPSRELTLLLQRLRARGLLGRVGRGRGCAYVLPRDEAGSAPPEEQPRSEHSGPRSEHSGPRSEHSGPRSEHSGPRSEHSELDIERGDDAAWRRLPSVEAVRRRRRASPEAVQCAILDACRGRFVTLQQLADGLERQPDTVRVHHLRPLLERGALALRFPGAVNHPQQAYRTREGASEETR